VVEQAQAGGDGRHLLLSWIPQEGGADDDGRYQIMLAEVELDTAMIQSSAAPGKSTQAAAFATAGPGRNRGNSDGQQRVLLAFGRPCLRGFC
jgi:hypothetical protein